MIKLKDIKSEYNQSTKKTLNELTLLSIVYYPIESDFIKMISKLQLIFSGIILGVLLLVGFIMNTIFTNIFINIILLLVFFFCLCKTIQTKNKLINDYKEVKNNINNNLKI